MAVNKNFVVKNGLEVNDDLFIVDIDNRFVGVGTSTPSNTLHVFGGIGATDVNVVGHTTTADLTVGTSKSIFTVVDATNFVGVGTDVPAYLLDIRGPAGTGYTSLYVQGDVRLTGDLIADDLTFDQAIFNSLEVTGFTTLTSLQVGYGASIAGITTFKNVVNFGDNIGTGISVVGVSTFNTDLNVLGDLNVTGDLVYDEVDGRNLNITGIATIHTLGVSSTASITDLNVGGATTISGNLTVSGDTVLSGVVTATSFSGVGQIGIGSEGTAIGSGVTFLNIASSSGSAIAMDPPTSGIATVTITPGVSLGLAIALGG